MKTIRYTADALKSLKKHGNVADRIRQAITDVASETGARANNVTQLVGSTAYRLKVGDFRVIFEQTETSMVITKIGPRASAYD